MLDRAPLRIKLVAAILVLVTVALLVIGAASVFVVRGYLIDRMDDQMERAAGAVYDGRFHLGANETLKVVLPCDYVRITSVNGVGDDPSTDLALTDGQMPKLVTGIDAVSQADRRPFTETSADGKMHWRVLVTVLPS